jgi:hypothetical protein
MNVLVYSYVYLISEKSKALDKFKIFKAKIKNKLNFKIKVVRSDRAGEYYDRQTTWVKVQVYMLCLFKK